MSIVWGKIKVLGIPVVGKAICILSCQGVTQSILFTTDGFDEHINCVPLDTQPLFMMDLLVISLGFKLTISFHLSAPSSSKTLSLNH